MHPPMKHFGGGGGVGGGGVGFGGAGGGVGGGGVGFGGAGGVDFSTTKVCNETLPGPSE